MVERRAENRKWGREGGVVRAARAGVAVVVVVVAAEAEAEAEAVEEEEEEEYGTVYASMYSTAPSRNRQAGICPLQ